MQKVFFELSGQFRRAYAKTCTTYIHTKIEFDGITLDGKSQWLVLKFFHAMEHKCQDRMLNYSRANTTLLSPR